MSEFATIILAAGNGTRMKSDLPKVMHKVANKPMLWHVLSAAQAAGSVKNVVIVQDCHADVKKLALEFTNTEIAVQQEQRGTGDAVKAAEALLTGFTGKAVILNGDCPLVGLMGDELAEFIDANKDVSVLGFEAEDPTGYGRLLIEDEKVSAIIEEKDANDEQKQIRSCNSGVYAVDAKLLFELLAQLDNNNSQGEYYLTDIIAAANAQSKDVAYKIAAYQSVLLGVNNKSQLADAEAIMQDELVNAALDAGVTITSPSDTFLSADTKFGRDVTIKPFTYIDSNVEIADGAQIGPFAHLRAGTRVGAGAKIGNFVEVKNANIGAGAKVSHLSYVGDAVVGADANIGAGTITCNYDGFNKFTTTIGAGAFIGSNTALVAPVEVGAGAIVAAGSTITNDVDSDALAVARARQKSLTDGAKKFKAKAKK